MSEAVQAKLDEQQLVALLLHKRVITEGQLKAALDYQKSLGGEVLDILHKLGLVRSSNVEDLLREAEVKEAAAKRNEVQVLDPGAVDSSELKLHHKLLDKLPEDLVAEYGFACFFPLAKTGTRKIVLGHGSPAPEKILRRVQELLNVEVCALQLEPSVANGFLDQYYGRKGVPRPKKKGTPASSRESSPSARRKTASTRSVEDSGDQTSVPAENERDGRRLEALIGLLIKKRIIAADEYEVELRLGASKK